MLSYYFRYESELKLFLIKIRNRFLTKRIVIKKLGEFWNKNEENFRSMTVTKNNT